MRKVLVPVDGSRASLCAVRHVIAESQGTEGCNIHLLNVQRPLRQHVAQFLSRATRESFYRDESEKALRCARAMLEDARMSYVFHAEVGPPADIIAEKALQLGCNQIVMGTARKSSLTRAIESSVTNQVLEITRVQVVVIAEDKASIAERYAVPAAVGGALALLLLSAAD
jgi:nucleotide-binding universal stress UspA family protein